MAETFGEKTPVARKDYECNACLFILEDLDYTVDLCSFAEKRQLVQARKEGWMIKKGQQYRYYNFKDGGEITWGLKERLDMAAICDKHDLYPEF